MVLKVDPIVATKNNEMKALIVKGMSCNKTTDLTLSKTLLEYL